MSHVVESDRFRLGQLDLASISAIVGKLAMLRFAKAPISDGPSGSANDPLSGRLRGVPRCRSRAVATRPAHIAHKPPPWSGPPCGRHGGCGSGILRSTCRYRGPCLPHKPRLGSERPREFSRHLGHLAKMVGHFFDTPIFGNMGYVHEYLPSVGAIARRSAIKYNSS